MSQRPRPQDPPEATLRGAILAFLLGTACANASAGRPGIDYPLPPEPPVFSAPLPLEDKPPGSRKDTPARLLKSTKPVYPRWAREHKIQGTVTIEVLVDERGKVARWEILKSIPSLDAAAVQCVRQWVFSPAIVRGRPAATTTMAPVTFKLER
jgi:TonB family protein